VVDTVVKQVFILTGLLLFGSASALPQDVQINSPILLTAKTAQLLSEVIGKKSEKSSFNAEIDRILRLAEEAKLWANYRYMSGPRADIIIKIEEDRTLVSSETISLTVFNPENNEKIYSETRDLVDLSNDVSRLIAHFLAAVARKKQEYSFALRDAAARQEQRERKGVSARREVEQVSKLQGDIQVKITCQSVELYANRASERRVVRVLHKGDLVSLVMPAQEEFVVKSGNDVGYVDAECVGQDNEKRPAAGGLHVSSRPEGADVFINGVRQSGKTPLTLTLTPGQYNLVLRMAGYDVYAGSVQVGDAVQTELKVELKQKAGL
jgi:hypothetical protein